MSGSNLAAPAAAGKPSPFQRADSRQKRLKLFLWGDSGVGKTTLALRFPRPVVLDLERGTEHYGSDFEFDRLHATTSGEVEDAIAWLLSNDHDYRTLIIDPITVYWEALQHHWAGILGQVEGRKGSQLGGAFYEFQPKDWSLIKGQLKATIRRLHALDMHVIVTAREKPKYSEGGFMSRAGETFDGEKSLPYLFDVVLRVMTDEKRRRIVHTLKDRTRQLPADPWVLDYATIEAAYGADQMARRAEVATLIRSDQMARIKELIDELGITDAQVAKRLPDYGAKFLDELTVANADLLISKLEAAAGVCPAAKE